MKRISKTDKWGHFWSILVGIVGLLIVTGVTLSECSRREVERLNSYEVCRNSVRNGLPNVTEAVIKEICK